MNLAEAYDQMMEDGAAALPVGFPIAYEDNTFTIPADTPWARITCKHAGRAQRGFGDNIKKYVAFGTLCVEVFTPAGSGLTVCHELVADVINYLDGAGDSSRVLYSKIRPDEIGRDGGFYKINVYANFEYEDHH